MMKLCRELFPTLLEKEGTLASILLQKFEQSRFLYNDIVESNMEEDFKNYIYSFIDVENNITAVTKSPKELLDEAGYTLYECLTEEDIQKFKRYYAQEEELCTFRNERLNNCFVFFAVKKDVDNIKRENFLKPQREDEYGTSVISIQFTRGTKNTLSIKNRYNHHVNNPDATFQNNLDNIIPGLNQSFVNEYGFNFQNENSDFEMLNYVKANDGKFYKYNYEIYNVYYCPNNIIIDNFEVKKYPKEQYIVLDYFILDLKNKKISLYDNRISDSFIDAFDNIEQITVINNGKNKKIRILKNNREIFITVNDKNEIIFYQNDQLKEIGDEFLSFNLFLEGISLSQVQEIGDYFLPFNKYLTEILMPQVQKIGKNFLHHNFYLEEISLPQVQEIGDNFLACNKILREILMPQVRKIGDNFLASNEILTVISMPQVQEIGDDFLYRNHILTVILMSQVRKIGKRFLYSNSSLTEISLLQVQEIGDYFLACNKLLKEILMPQVQKIGKNPLSNNPVFAGRLLASLNSKRL